MPIRLCSSTNSHKDTSQQHQPQRRQYAFDRLQSFGTVLIKSQGSLEYNIRALDPVKHPDQDVAAIDAPSCVLCQDESDDLISLYGQATDDLADSSHIDAQVPLKYDVAGNFIEGSSVDISELENQRISLNMDGGACSLHKVKCDAVKIRGRRTPIVCKPSLHANASIVTHAANIRADKLLGDRCELECVATGNVYIGDSYVNRLSVTTHRGHIDIGSCHRDVQLFVLEKGRIDVASLDGNLSVKAAEALVTVHVQRHENISISILAGDVRLTLPRDVITQVRLASTDVSVDADAFDTSHLKKTIRERKYNWEGLLLGRDVELETANKSDSNDGASADDGASSSATDSSGSNTGHGGAGGVSRHRSRNMVQITVQQGSIHLSSADWLSTLKLGRGISQHDSEE